MRTLISTRAGVRLAWRSACLLCLLAFCMTGLAGLTLLPTTASADTVLAANLWDILKGSKDTDVLDEKPKAKPKKKSKPTKKKPTAKNR